MLRNFLICLTMTLVLAQAAAASDKDGFGLGPVLGEPTGLNAQFFWDRSAAVDFTGAWSWNEWILLSADFQMYDFFLDMPREWKWYYGGGAYLSLANDDHSDNSFGVRVPVGLKYHFPYTIIDVWGEVAPGVELAPTTRGSLQGGIGLTFWLW